MAETQRQRVPRTDGSELDTALSFLDFARSCVLKKTDGLAEKQLRTVLVESGTTILGLVQHLAASERYWFGYHLAGAGSDAAGRHWDFSGQVPAQRSTAEVLADYRAATAASNAAIRSAGDPDARVVRPVDGLPLTMRWVIAHMTSETARHAGHADILREQLDGTTGR